MSYNVILVMVSPGETPTSFSRLRLLTTGIWKCSTYTLPTCHSKTTLTSKMLLVGQIMPLKHVCERRRKKRGVPFPQHHKCCIPDVCGWEHRALLAVVDLADTRVPSLHCPALICAPTCNPTSCFLRGSKISFVSHIVVILLPEVLVIWSGGQQSGDTLHSTEVGGQNPTDLWQKYFL